MYERGGIRLIMYRVHNTLNQYDWMIARIITILCEGLADLVGVDRHIK